MKFECEKTLLASAIDGVSRAITNRAAIPVLEGIYMKAEGFNLTLTGYDSNGFPPYQVQRKDENQECGRRCSRNSCGV